MVDVFEVCVLFAVDVTDVLVSMLLGTAGINEQSVCETLAACPSGAPRSVYLTAAGT